MSFQSAVPTVVVPQNNNREVAIREEEDRGPLTAKDIKDQVQLIQEVMQAVMQEGYHYGVIPGTEKPSLLKAGAEKLTMTFRLAPLLNIEARELGNGHREYQVRCTLTHIPTGRVYGEGVGSCSTLESRYRYRKAERICPECGQPKIQKGKVEYGGGWLCWQKKGGCGAKFDDNDPEITSQSEGRIENADLADTYNTVLKMAKKRALVDATLTATAASDIFNQDLDEMSPEQITEVTRSASIASRPAPTPQQQQSRPYPQQQQPSAQAMNNKPLTKGQVEILLLSQRRAKISDQDLKSYLAQTYRITEYKDLQQSSLNAVLEWMEREKVSEFITPAQVTQLKEACHQHNVPDKVFLDLLKGRGADAIEKLPAKEFDDVMAFITGANSPS